MRRRTPTGIIWVGMIFDASGYGSVSRNCLLGLKRAGFPVKAVNFGPPDRELLSPRAFEEVRELTQSDVGPYPIGIVHHLPEVYHWVEFKSVAKRIGFTIFETDRIPDSWVGPCNNMDEVWVPSHFNLQTFVSSGVDRERIRILPYGVNTEFFAPITEKLDVGQVGFCFLYVLHYDWRKGLDILLEAYLREFWRTADVTLILKVQPGQKTVRQIWDLVSTLSQGLRLTRGDIPRILVVADAMNEEQLRQLYNACDLYISTDRANGWGMPCMEAMAMGKPAATIDWSGSTEFMTEHNSLLIKPTGKLVPVDARLSKRKPIYRGHRWAEVKVEEVRRVMRHAFENRGSLEAIASRGMEEVRKSYSLVSVGERIRDYVSSIELGTDTVGSSGVRIGASLARRAVRKVRHVVRKYLRKELPRSRI